MARMFLLIVTAGLVLAPQPLVSAVEGARYAVIVQGASGEPQYATLHRGWVDALSRTLIRELRLPPGNVIRLTEQPGEGELRGTAENVRAVLGRLAKETGPDDLVFIMLIGHGSGDAQAAKFNLVGPDLTTEEWKALVAPIRARVAFVDSTSSSFPFLAGLAADNRIVITATATYAQRYHTIFPDAFIRALTAPDADGDKNGRISLLEAFVFASRLVSLHYEQDGRMATERAMIDDTGTGKGRDAQAAGPPDTLAGLTYLDVPVAPQSADPALQQLLVRQQALVEQVDELRRRRASMTPEEFDRQFEALIVELALVSRDVRRRAGR